MRDYEVKEGKGQHVFQDYDSEAELLRAISDWFEQLSEETPTIEFIRFEYCDDGAIDATVFWTYLTESTKEELEKALSIQRELRSNEIEISEN